MARRMEVLRGQLASPACQEPGNLVTSPTAAKAHRQLPRFDAGVMERYMDPNHELKGEVYGIFREHPELLVKELEALSKEEHRELVRRCLHALLAGGQSPLSLLANDPKTYFYLGELLAMVDLSLAIKMGVQYSLWGGSIINLGTERHKRKYFHDIDVFNLPGARVGFPFFWFGEGGLLWKGVGGSSEGRHAAASLQAPTPAPACPFSASLGLSPF